MDFSLNQEQKLLKESVAKLSRAEFGPRARETDEKKRYPKENIQKLSELGLMGRELPHQ